MSARIVTRGRDPWSSNGRGNRHSDHWAVWERARQRRAILNAAIALLILAAFLMEVL